MNRARNIALYGFFTASLITFILSLILLVLISNRLNEFQSVASAPEITPTAVPDTTAAQWSVPNPDNPAQNLISVYALSTRWDHQGAPSLRFYDTDINHSGSNRSFEIGFYHFGPTWYSTDSITEFWLGDGHGGIFSVAGNNQGGGDLQVRNPADTGSIQLDFRDADHPTILAEGTTPKPLYFQSKPGLVSENHHTFLDGLSISGSEYSWQVTSDLWENGRLSVSTTAVQEDSFVNIMPLSESAGRWWICGITAGQKFTLCSSAPDETMQFRWLIVGTS
jgi:hypothetical protein